MRGPVIVAALLSACTPSAPRRTHTAAARETASTDEVIARERWRIKACFNEALRLDPHAGGTYKLRFETGTNGAVTRIAVVSSEGTPWLGDCLARSFLDVRFAPPADGHAEFTVPFVLSSSGPPDLGPMRCAIRQSFDVCDTIAIDDAALALLGQKKPDNVLIVFRRESRNSDVATITRWPGVRRIMLLHSAVDDISSLAGLSDLEFVALVDTKVTKLSALASITKLRILDLRRSPIVDISPLAKLTSLETVVLAETGVQDLWPLLGSAKSLKRLVVPKGTPESSLSTFRATNPAIEIAVE